MALHPCIFLAPALSLLVQQRRRYFISHASSDVFLHFMDFYKSTSGSFRCRYSKLPTAQKTLVYCGRARSETLPRDCFCLLMPHALIHWTARSMRCLRTCRYVHVCFGLLQSPLNLNLYICCIRLCKKGRKLVPRENKIPRGRKTVLTGIHRCRTDDVFVFFGTITVAQRSLDAPPTRSATVACKRKPNGPSVDLWTTTALHKNWPHC